MTDNPQPPTGQPADMQTEPAPPADSAAAPPRKRMRYWILAALFVGCLCFALAERYILDADTHDISYAKLVLKSNAVADPKPGQVYVFDHHNNRFVETMLCSLQILVANQSSDRLRASNIWGGSLNGAIEAVSDYVPQKIASLMHVEKAELEWVFTKEHRPRISAPMESDCLAIVVTHVQSPDYTPFIVDAVYTVEHAGDVTKWVSFAPPLLMEPGHCVDCPEPMRVRDVIGAYVGRFTRIKVDNNIVQVH
ncbi:MAG: hypothetical protein OIF47_12245 [Marinibacterium sp.]|nr:hypothetical protein [Marinibacterium sp.]